MVNLFYILFCCILAVPSFGKGTELRLEFSKPKLYSGELVFCNFVLYSDSPMLEIEVAKFPEFRGFWSENLTLRQGPLALAADPNSNSFKTTIGSYLLTPMIGNDSPSIHPMKLVILDDSRRSVLEKYEVQSKSQKITITQLPKIPSSLAPPESFFGAVGSFTLSIEQTHLPFRKGEPVLIRYHLQGSGNYQEIIELPIVFPLEVSVVSTQSFNNGTSRFFSKTFEYIVAPESDTNIAIPSFDFIYYDPNKAKYRKIQTQPIVLDRYVQPIDPNDKVDLNLPVPFTNYSFHTPWRTTIWFALLNAVAGFALMGIVISVLRRIEIPRRKKNKLTAPNYDAQKAVAAWNSGQTEHFIEFARKAVLFSLLQEIPNCRLALPQKQILKQALANWPDDRVRSAEAILDAYDLYAYAPSKAVPTELAALLEDLTTSVQMAS